MTTIYAHPYFIRHDEGLNEGSPDTARVVDAEILQLAVQNSSITMTEMATAMGISTTTVERALRRLKAAGRTQRVGAKKNGRWNVL